MYFISLISIRALIIQQFKYGEIFSISSLKSAIFCFLQRQVCVTTVNCVWLNKKSYVEKALQQALFENLLVVILKVYSRMMNCFKYGT